MHESSVSEKSIEEEFFSSCPKDYKKGKTKYIIITGSVMSSVGKGTFSSCLGTLLSCHGFNVSPIKFDGYLNYDAGTLIRSDTERSSFWTTAPSAIWT